MKNEEVDLESPNSDDSTAQEYKIVPTPGPSDPTGRVGKIAAELEERFMRGVYHFGETLSITSLTQQFEGSRQPVASAINHLRSCGYLEIIPQVGVRIVSPTPEEIADFYEMYGKVEGVIASLAAKRYVGKEASTLLSIANQIEASDLYSVNERARFQVGVAAFHRQISAMARSPTLTSRIDGIRRISMFYLWQGSSEFRPKTAIYMNKMRIKVAEAIKARDANEAARLTEEHIQEKPRWAGIVKE